MLCRDGRFEDSPLEPRVVKTLVARENHQTTLGKFFNFEQKRTLPLVEPVKIDGALLRIPTFAPFMEFSITIHSSLLPIVGRHPAALAPASGRASNNV